MAYGQRGHAGCNHSPSRGGGGTLGQLRCRLGGGRPDSSSSSLTPDVDLQGFPEGSLRQHRLGMHPAAHTLR